MPHSENSCQLLRRFSQLRSIRRPVPTPLVMLFVALVLSRFDYGNAVLATSLPVQPSAVGARQFPLVEGPLPERVQFKLATIAYRSLNGTAPHYLAVDLYRSSDMPSRRRLRSSSH